MISNALPFICGAIVLAVSIFEARLVHGRKRLRRKLRRALQDCLALYEIEKRMADFIALENAGDTELSVKRHFRAQLREEGFASPSEHCTPHQIFQELEDL